MALTARPLTDHLSVAPQLEAADFQAAKQAGFKAIINNRPDGEEPGQLPAAEAAQIAAQLGLVYIHQPVTTPMLNGASAAAFADALAGAPVPVLAHCRSGTRSTILWSLAEAKAGTRSLDEILRAAADSGYDVAAYLPMMTELQRSSR